MASWAAQRHREPRTPSQVSTVATATGVATLIKSASSAGQSPGPIGPQPPSGGPSFFLLGLLMPCQPGCQPQPLSPLTCRGGPCRWVAMLTLSPCLYLPCILSFPMAAPLKGVSQAMSVLPVLPDSLLVLAESQPLFTVHPVAIKSKPSASLVTSHSGRSSNSSRGRGPAGWPRGLTRRPKISGSGPQSHHLPAGWGGGRLCLPIWLIMIPAKIVATCSSGDPPLISHL